MLKHYLVTAFNNLFKNGLFTFINVGGLAIGLAACILISLYVQNETSYDRQWSNADALYRLNTSIVTGGNDMKQSSGSAGAAWPTLQQEYADEIALGTRTLSLSRIVAYGDRAFQEPVVGVDADFINIFELETVAGSIESSLADLSSIALSADLASRLFGAENPVGKVVTVTFNKFSRDHQVGAVYRLPEGNTVLELPALVQFDATEWVNIDENWTALSFLTWLQLAPGVDPVSMAQRLDDFVDRHADLSMLRVDPAKPASESYQLALQNIRDIHLDSAFDTQRAGGNRMVVLAFSAISVLVLLIGCINFTILSTAKATARVREAAVRKTVGATRWQLMLQHLGESFLIVLPSLLLALVIVELALPAFSALVDRSLAVPYGVLSTWLWLVLLPLSVGLAGGLYPAFVLSHPRPGMLSAHYPESPGSANMRGALVVFQFSIAIALMIATTVIHMQVRFASSRDPGFNSENLLTISDVMFRSQVSSVRNTLKQELLALPSISSVSFSATQPTQQTGYANTSLSITVPGESGTGSQRITALSIDHDFFTTYEIPLVAGRNYSQELDRPSSVLAPGPRGQAVDSISNVIINASAAKQLGFANIEASLGQQVSTESPISGRTEVMNIVGVVADTHFLSMNAVPRAEAYLLSPGSTDVVTVRFQGDPQALVASVTEVWQRVVGDAELKTAFVEQNMAAEFEQDQTQADLLLSFSLLAIFITCMGLFGSAAFNIERRTHEIGVRKVMGAEVRQIVQLLLWQFSRPVLLANVIAWPLALMSMIDWLQRFAYRIDLWLLVPISIAAGLAALCIAWVTVSGIAARAASAKPVLALRYE